MLNKLKSQREGFTIIEVIIVLVIGAVILLAVFLVVPQLQNAQRNSRQRAIAQQYLSAYEELRAQAGGNLPINATNILSRAGGQLKNGTQAVNIITSGNANLGAVVITQNAKCNPEGTLAQTNTGTDSVAVIGAYPGTGGTNTTQFICVGPKL